MVAALFVNNPKIAGRIFGLRFGEIREGCAGDVVIFDYMPPTPLDGTNLFGHLVFGLSQSAVDSTIVGGRVLMENKRLATEPGRGARERARARAGKGIMETIVTKTLLVKSPCEHRRICLSVCNPEPQSFRG